MEDSISEQSSKTTITSIAALENHESTIRQNRTSFGDGYNGHQCRNLITNANNASATNDSQEENGQDEHTIIRQSSLSLEAVEAPDDLEYEGILPEWFYYNQLESQAGCNLREAFEVEWPDLFRNPSFTCFSKLPVEIRRKIWLHLLPGPRLVELTYTVDVVTASICFSDYIYSTKMKVPQHLLWTCRESNEVFLEHYQRPKIKKRIDEELPNPGLPPQPSYINVDCKGWIDLNVDTLLIDKIEEILADLEFLEIHSDLSKITNLAISEVFKGGLEFRRPSLPELLENEFPNLRHLSLIANFEALWPEYTKYTGDFGPPTIVPTQNLRFLYELRGVVRFHRRKFHNPQLIIFRDMDMILEDPDILRKNFLEQAKTRYWESIGVTVGFLAMLKRLDYTSEMALHWSGNWFDVNIDDKGSVGDQYLGIKELFGGYEPPVSKYLRCPWN